jgi:hypothetical protein
MRLQRRKLSAAWIDELKLANRCGNDVVKVLKSLQPYKGGNKLLRTIHDMDIADKHQSLITVFGAMNRAYPVNADTR